MKALKLRNAIDPHAWQDVANAKIYVANIRDALVKADPGGKDVYEANAAAYLRQLDSTAESNPGFELFRDGFESGDTSAWSSTIP